MSKKDPKVDAYIAKSKPFAQPILKHLRKVILATSPEITETTKWSAPSYEYKGLLCGFAGFKEHAIFGFWKHELVVGTGRDGSGGSFGHLKTIADLPSEAKLKAMIKKAMKLNDDGVAAPHMVNRKKHKPLPMPADLKTALSRDSKAKTHFEAFSPSAQREYIEWITGAKAAETREKRLLTAIEWIAEGKRRNWKYER
jgi:uncharacterized protein YdeI (YjbR/CyaY-like superfamily)